MKKNMILSVATMAVMATSSFAGGDIAPIIAPVEPMAAPMKVPVYVGAGLVWGKYNKTCANCEYEDVTYGVMLRAGYEFNEYIGIELRYLATFWEADPLGGQELQHIGIYAKPMYPVDEKVNLYALLGFGWTQTTTDSKNLEEVDESGFSAGAGIEYTLEQNWGLFADYQRLLIKSDVPDMDVVSAGITYDF